MRHTFKNGIALVVLGAFGIGAFGIAQPRPGQVASSAKWLFGYVHDPFKHGDVRNDPRYRSLLQQSLRQQAFFWGHEQHLWRVADIFLDVGSGEVEVKNDRYGIIDGCVPHMCDEDEGFLWVDTAPKVPEVIFAALTAIPGEGIHGSPSLFHLWIFSNRPLRQDFVNNESLPDEFLYPMQDWIDEIGGRHVVSAMFVGPDNQMTPLLTQSLHLPAFQAATEAKKKESQ